MYKIKVFIILIREITLLPDLKKNGHKKIALPRVLMQKRFLNANNVYIWVQHAFLSGL